ncbi:hypothetical protein GCM10010343_63260 [Streptomyces avidinii]|nr:hypothetical protein GCM10010343_63260 [Streptomyces avidinii]
MINGVRRAICERHKIGAVDEMVDGMVNGERNARSRGAARVAAPLRRVGCGGGAAAR